MMKNKISFFEKTVTLLERFSMFFAAFILLTMMTVIIADTILRHFFNHPILGVLEVVEGFFMVAIVFFGISDSFRAGEHIRVDLLSKNFRGRFKNINEIILQLVVAFFFIVIGLKAYKQMTTALSLNQMTIGALSIPIAPAYLIVVIGSFLFVIRLMLTIFSLTFGRVKEG
ncbi:MULTISPECIES: TRAP transporter small permease [Sporosarcina]|uniref:TRAP transporter small permease n=1 Tax=Sporosarcina TaxID=1569 RepID=UPI000A165B40|nr:MULTISPECIES: TRAP transporter small permease subunit [Sporosarcina]ARJ39590.1 hypothetical protein SporoP8_12320 [Sporosarcina ureae]PIC68008.1 TRAP transporter small permease [Sporosarcina sp. P16a]PIC94317.1 TRAP transporter small permease [Sporosarcina sp. P25]PID23628.1 TRAP transporter small permease [Sporosarcina sp. P7]